MFIAYYLFGPGHKERHYPKNPAGRRYESAISRDPAAAKRYNTSADAEAAVRKFLANHPTMIPCVDAI